MKFSLSFLLSIVISFNLFSQNKIIKTVVNSVTKEPLEYATIYNNKDFSLSNQEGKFIFNSVLDSIKIKMVGFDEFKSRFQDLKNSSDTIVLNPKTYQLEEIIVQNNKKILYKVYQNIEKNYAHFPYKENFFLRCLQKKNDEILKFEDMYGRMQRNSLFTSQSIKKIDFDLELLNLRKVGLQGKSKEIEDHKFHDFKGLMLWFSTVFINPEDFEFSSEKINETNYIKISFIPLEKFRNKNRGYYIIDKKDFSIKEYYSETNPLFSQEIKFEEKLGFKWRTTKSELLIKFNKNENIGFSYISSANLKQQTEVFNRKQERNNYITNYDFFNIDSFIKESIKSNTSINKDLFEINYPYSSDFWTNQNQLLLTKEMKVFLEKLNEKDNEFVTISNIK